jgi:hypothetical protein
MRGECLKISVAAFLVPNCEKKFGRLRLSAKSGLSAELLGRSER